MAMIAWTSCWTPIAATRIAIAIVTFDGLAGRPACLTAFIRAQRPTLYAPRLRHRPNVAHHRQHEMRRRLARAVHLHCRRAVVGGLGLEDVGDVRLRVAVDNREPRALHL